MLNEDYKEMLQSLLDNEVEFLIIGAYAMAVYGYPRATGDLDLWVFSSKENAEKVYRALIQFGAPLSEINKNSFSEKGIVFQIGVAPRRIDIITNVDGVNFVEAYTSREEIELDDLKVPFISKANLIKNKKATGREKDRLDANTLENSQ